MAVIVAGSACCSMLLYCADVRAPISNMMRFSLSQAISKDPKEYGAGKCGREHMAYCLARNKFIALVWDSLPLLATVC